MKDNNTSFIKMIAFITMIIDHIGVVFFPSNLIFRIIGRVSFPLFAYSTFIGYKKTSDLKKYIFRIFVFGVITQPIYMTLFNKGIFDFNIMFTLLFELCLLYLFDKKKYLIIPFVYVLLFFLNINYSYQIMFLVPIFYYLSNNLIYYSLSFLLMNVILLLNSEFLNIFSIFALPFMFIKTNIKIYINKWFYYVMYPGHLLILYLIKVLL